MKFLAYTILFCLPFYSFAQYNSGTSYFDSTNYVEYIAGDLPIILSAPHGGYLEPANIPDRNCSGCSYIRDSYTQELVRELKDALYNRTGCYPHVVINLLHRKKLDANRAIIEAADSNVIGETAWFAYHNFINKARASLNANYSQGLFLDMHGHGHSIQRLELGYRLSKTELQLSDSTLNFESSTIEHLAANNLSNHNLSTLIRGTESFGALCENRGYPSVPSFSTPYPLTSEPYFQGGYNTIRYGSQDSGTIDGIQIECNSGVRFNAADRAVFADSLVVVILDYLDLHYFANLSPNYCLPTSIKRNLPKLKARIAPNPAKEILAIYSEHYPLDVSIYNQIGICCQITTLASNTDKIDLSSLNCGLYYVELRGEGIEVQVQKLIKACP